MILFESFDESLSLADLTRMSVSVDSFSHDKGLRLAGSKDRAKIQISPADYPNARH